MDSIGVFLTILFIVMGIGFILAIVAVFLVNNSSSWWTKL